MRTEVVRHEIQRLIRQAPFRPFVLSLENGDRISIDHPENIAFQPSENGAEGSAEFFVLTNQLRLFSTFEAVSSVALLDEGDPSP